jgi:co-chaperonin GroES (HSP10)
MKYELNLTTEEWDKATGAIRPTGFRLLIALAKVADKVGSLYIPDGRKADEDVASILGVVVSMGPDCYKDESRFTGGSYCRVGDTIMMAAYTGRRIKIGDREFRLINDDSVIAVVEKPEEVSRA